MPMARVCYKCKKDKPLKDFHKDANDKDGHARLCRICTSAYAREYYAKNLERQQAGSRKRYLENKDVIKGRARGRRDRRKRHLRRYKAMCGCAHCGYKDSPVALDFHHTGDKSGEVSRMLSHTRSELFKEVRKCIVLCANCHRIEHHKGENIG